MGKFKGHQPTNPTAIDGTDSNTSPPDSWSDADEESRAVLEQLRNINKSKRSNNKNRSNKRTKMGASTIIQRTWRAALSRALTRPSVVASIVSTKGDKAAATSSHRVGIVKCRAYAEIIEKQYGLLKKHLLGPSGP